MPKPIQVNFSRYRNGSDHETFVEYSCIITCLVQLKISSCLPEGANPGLPPDVVPDCVDAMSLVRSELSV